jgi:hypothetical protein
LKVLGGAALAGGGTLMLGSKTRAAADALATTRSQAGNTVTYGPAVAGGGGNLYMTRSMIGQGSCRYYDRVTNRGGNMLEWGGNNHGYELNNSVGMVDLHAMVYRELVPWRQQKSPNEPAPQMPPFWRQEPTSASPARYDANTAGFNLYVSTYDNFPCVYFQSLDVLVYPSFGVVDFKRKPPDWVVGNRPPFTDGQRWFDYVKCDSHALAFFASSQAYDTAQVECPALDLCVIFGSGLIGSPFSPYYFILRKNPNYPREQWPLMFTTRIRPSWFTVCGYALNNGACRGTQCFIGDGHLDDGLTINPHFFLIDLTPCASGQDFTLIKKYANVRPPNPGAGNQVWPAVLYMPMLDKFVRLGHKVWMWNERSETFADRTPPNWGGASVRGLSGFGFNVPGAVVADDGSIYVKGGAALKSGHTEATDGDGWTAQAAAQIYKLTFPDRSER